MFLPLASWWATFLYCGCPKTGWTVIYCHVLGSWPSDNECFFGKMSTCINSRLFRKHTISVALLNKKITRLPWHRENIETCGFILFFSWNYEQGINLPEGRRWHCIAEFTFNLFNFFYRDVRREGNDIHSPLFLPSFLTHPLLSLGNRLLVFRTHQALKTMMMRGLPLTSLSLEDWQHHSWWSATWTSLLGPPFPNCSDPRGFFLWAWEVSLW